MGALDKMAIKAFIPVIKEKFVPTMEDLLQSVMDGCRDKLLEGEDRADIVIEKTAAGRAIVYICAMTPDNFIRRIIRKIELPELVDLLLSNLDKI